MGHGREGVESRAREGNENNLAVRKFGELAVVEDRKLSRRKVETLAGLTNEVAYVEVGLGEVREGGLAGGGSGGIPRRGERREVFHHDDGGSGTRSLKRRGS